MNPTEMPTTSDSHKNSGKSEDRDEGKDNFWLGAQPQFADKETSFESNLPVNTQNFP